MQGAHHVDHLFAHGAGALAPGGGGGVRGLGGEVAEGRVPPVVRAAALLQEQFALLGLDRQQFDRRDAEALQIGERDRMRQPGIGAAQLLGQPRRVGGEPPDVQLVEHGLAPRHVGVRRVGVVLGLVAVVDRDRQRHLAERVDGAHGAERRSDDPAVAVELALVGERRRVELHAAVDALAVRVEQQLVRVELDALLRVPGAVHAVGVAHAVPCLGQVDVPQAVIRPLHAEQGLAQVQGLDDARADRMRVDLIDERRRGILEDPDRVGEECGWPVDRLVDAQPYLIGCLRPHDGIGATVVGEVQSGPCGVSMRYRIPLGYRVLHIPIVAASIFWG